MGKVENTNNETGEEQRLIRKIITCCIIDLERQCKSSFVCLSFVIYKTYISYSTGNVCECAGIICLMLICC